MRNRSRLSKSSPTALIPSEAEELDITSEGITSGSPDLDADTSMSDVNGVLKEQNLGDGARATSGRITSASMMRSVMSSSESSPSSESNQWSSAIGHAGTGKSGRVIERLQGDIDRLRREKQVLKMRHEEAEKANEALVSRNHSLQDRMSNFEQSHETQLRQLARRERQVEDLREELRKEKLKTKKAEAQASAAAENEELWRDQASQAKALAGQRESEYDTVVACRKVDHDRYQNGLDKIRGRFDTLLRRQEDDLEKQKKLEIIAEHQRKAISHLEEMNKRLARNFKSYRHEIDTVVSELRETASQNDETVSQTVDEMVQVTGRMRWVMNMEDMANLANHQGSASGVAPRAQSPERPSTEHSKRSLSPTKSLFMKHRRKDSAKAAK